MFVGGAERADADRLGLASSTSAAIDAWARSCAALRSTSNSVRSAMSSPYRERTLDSVRREA
jgi:hypothetical protein